MVQEGLSRAGHAAKHTRAALIGALVRTISCDSYMYLPKLTTDLLYTRNRKRKKCRIAYCSYATATRRILLLFGDIELNPRWENGLMISDSSHVSNSERSESPTSSVNSYIPARISEGSYLHWHPLHNATRRRGRLHLGVVVSGVCVRHV